MVVAMIPHLTDANPKPGARVVKAREEAPIVVGRV